jgi:uncharacterized membrane protein
MKTLQTISIFLLALVSALFTPAGQNLLPVQAQTSQASKIAVVVLDANDARIAGATIKIENAQFSREVLSGEEGDFEFELPPGTYRITIEKDGFHRFELQAFRATAKSRELIKIHLKVMPPRGTLKV